MQEFCPLFLILTLIITNLKQRIRRLQLLKSNPSSTPTVPMKEDNSGEEETGQPHEALFFVLAYLPLFELLAMTKVCVSLRDASKRDVLLWLNILVETPLNSRLSDESLMKVASRAIGRLRSLTLINCAMITDDGLQRVIENNPFIKKLCLPGCTGLTANGIIRAVKSLSEPHHSLESLQINGIYNINKQDFEMLYNYLLMNQTNHVLEKKQNPIFFHDNTTNHRHEEDGRMIDVEICPLCGEVRMVFDCPKQACRRQKERSMYHCKGCKFCILRCKECGSCVKYEELEWAICADTLCSDCWIQLPKCSYCNKPYCKQHADLRISSVGSSGWVCEVCHMCSYDDEECLFP